MVTRERIEHFACSTQTARFREAYGTPRDSDMPTPEELAEIRELALRALDQAADARLGAAVRANLPHNVRGDDYEPPASIVEGSAEYFRVTTPRGWLGPILSAIAKALREEAGR